MKKLILLLFISTKLSASNDTVHIQVEPIPNETYKIYDTLGRQIQELNVGLNIVLFTNGTVRKIYKIEW